MIDELKVIKMFSGREYLILGKEAEKVAGLYGQDVALKLQTGDYINPKGISEICSPDKNPTWRGFRLDKEGRYFIRDGERIYLEPEHEDQIEWKLDKKYKEQYNKLIENNGQSRIESRNSETKLAKSH